jgi:cell division protein FtsW
MTPKKMDYTLFIVTMMLIAFGLLMVFSSSYYYAIEMGKDKMFFFNSELKWSIVGLVAMFIASVFNYKNYKPLAIPFFAVNVMMLVWVLVKGVTKNNAQRWIAIGTQTFQPVEFTKIAIILLVAFLLEKNYLKINQPKVLGVYLGIAGINAYLIMEQPNMSSAMIVVGIVAIMLFVAGLKWFYVFGVGTLGSFLAYFFIKSADYRYERWMAFLKPFEAKDDTAWQIIQSLYALGTGGLFGVGLGMSTQNKLYIPEPQNDFILATIGEEFGFIGTVILLALFLILIYRCIKIAINAPDTFSMFVASGITGMLSLQVIMNYAVATSSMPVTGVSLPFISYGGTSIMTLMGCIGIMLNISKYCGERTSKGD